MIGVSIFLRFVNRVMDLMFDMINTFVLWGTMLFGYVCLSLVIYAVLRRIVVPQKLHVRPVYFNYEPCARHQIENRQCSFPRADFILESDRRLLVSGQPYQVTIHLELPESPVNLELGMFMVNLSFYSSEGRAVSSSARPVLLRYKSYVVHMATTLLYLVPLTLGLMEEKQMVSLVLYENYYDSYKEPATSASLVATSYHVQIYSASLTIEATFSGFVYLLYQWPITMAFITSFCICTWLMVCTTALWIRQWVGPVRRIVRRPSTRVLSSTPRSVANVSPLHVPRSFSTPPPRGYVGQGGPKLVARTSGRFSVISEENGVRMERNLSVEDTRKLLLQHGVKPEMLPRSYSDVFPSSSKPSSRSDSPSLGEHSGLPASAQSPHSASPLSETTSESPIARHHSSSSRNVSFNISEDEDTHSDDAFDKAVYVQDDQPGVPRFRRTKL